VFVGHTAPSESTHHGGPAKTSGNYQTGFKAARQAGDPAVAAWVLGNTSYLLTHEGTKASALDAAQAAVGKSNRRSEVTAQLAWLGQRSER